jgi:hypothetical protein
MLIEYNNTQYKIYFKHIRKTAFTRKMELWHWKDVVPNDISICFIENTLTKEIIAQGISKCSKKDYFVKEVGRQISLVRALSKIDDTLLKFLILQTYYKNKTITYQVGELIIKYNLNYSTSCIETYHKPNLK